MRRVVDEQKFKQIQEGRQQGMELKELSKKYGVSIAVVQRVCTNKIYQRGYKDGTILTDAQKNEIRRKILAGEDRMALAEEYEVSLSSIHNYGRNAFNKLYGIPTTTGKILEALANRKAAFKSFKDQFHIGDKLKVKVGKRLFNITVSSITESNIFGKTESGRIVSFTWNSIFCGDSRIQKVC